jgi:oxygen-independent coproporphyrinogen-3 oxidase
MFALTCDALRDAGYVHYEVSNWAKPGFECRHNLGYWRRRPYLGLGAGAHSYREGRRWWNTRPPEAYLQQIESGIAPTGGAEVLTPEEIHTEDLLLRLRTSEGIAAGDVDATRADVYLQEGLLARRNGSYFLTERGMFLANEVVLALSG